MPVVIERRITISNDNITSWNPEIDVVEGITFIKLDIKDRRFFRFCTGRPIKLGRQFENSKYKLKFWEDMVKARSDACQEAFDKMQAELQDEDDGARRRHKRPRIARMDDAETVGRINTATISHGEVNKHIKVLFGIKKSALWIEAAVDNLDFIAQYMKTDYDNNNFAETRPRGAYFRRNAFLVSNESPSPSRAMEILDGDVA